mgnify:CR=1 FL=1
MPKGVRCVVRTLPVPWQSGQTSGVVPGGAARAVAVGALLDLGDVYLLLAAEGRLLKADRDGGAQALAAPRAAALGRAAAEAEYVAKISEYISKAAETAKTSKAGGSVKTSEALARVEGRVTELVILGTLIRVASTWAASFTSLNFASASLSPG